MHRSLIRFATVVFFGACIFTTPFNQAARADYVLPHAAETYRVVPDTWSLAKQGSNWHLKCIYKGKAYDWLVDKFLLADRLDSDSICSGKDEELTESYLQAMSEMKVRAGVQVVADSKGGPLGSGRKAQVTRKRKQRKESSEKGVAHIIFGLAGWDIV